SAPDRQHAAKKCRATTHDSRRRGRSDARACRSSGCRCSADAKAVATMRGYARAAHVHRATGTGTAPSTIPAAGAASGGGCARAGAAPHSATPAKDACASDATPITTLRPRTLAERFAIALCHRLAVDHMILRAAARDLDRAHHRGEIAGPFPIPAGGYAVQQARAVRVATASRVDHRGRTHGGNRVRRTAGVDDRALAAERQ